MASAPLTRPACSSVRGCNYRSGARHPCLVVDACFPRLLQAPRIRRLISGMALRRLPIHIIADSGERTLPPFVPSAASDKPSAGGCPFRVPSGAPMRGARCVRSCNSCAHSLPVLPHLVVRPRRFLARTLRGLALHPCACFPRTRPHLAVRPHSNQRFRARELHRLVRTVLPCACFPQASLAASPCGPPAFSAALPRASPPWAGALWPALHVLSGEPHFRTRRHRRRPRRALLILDESQHNLRKPFHSLFQAPGRAWIILAGKQENRAGQRQPGRNGHTPGGSAPRGAT